MVSGKLKSFLSGLILFSFAALPLTAQTIDINAPPSVNKTGTVLASPAALDINASPSVQKADDDSFYFVQLSDMHFGKSRNAENTEAIIDSINKLPMEISFVVVSGDIVDKGMSDNENLREAVSTLKKIRYPIHFIPGNHDIDPKNPENDAAIYKKVFGDLSYTVQCKNTVLFFIYTEPIKRDFKLLGYDGWKLFEDGLKNAAGKPIIVFTHAPPVPDFRDGKFHKSWPPESAAKIEAMLNLYNVKALVTGHFHRDELCWLGNVPVYVCEPVSAQRGRLPAYRIYYYKNGKLGYSAQYLSQK